MLSPPSNEVTAIAYARRIHHFLPKGADGNAISYETLVVCWPFLRNPIRDELDKRQRRRSSFRVPTNAFLLDMVEAARPVAAERQLLRIAHPDATNELSLNEVQFLDFAQGELEQTEIQLPSSLGFD